MNCSLFEIPEALIHNGVMTLLSLKDLVRLDTAFASGSRREEIRLLFRGLQLSEMIYLSYNSKWAGWIVKREIRFRIFLSRRDVSCESMQYLISEGAHYLISSIHWIERSHLNKPKERSFEHVARELKELVFLVCGLTLA